MITYARRLSVLTLLTVVAFATFATNLAAADRDVNWSQWRGPHHNGSSDAKNLPAEFGKDKNLLWSTTLPGTSNSTPIIHGDRIFSSVLDTNSKNLLAVCLNRADGKVLWQKEVGIGFTQKGENNMATPSPVTDGKTVWFLYGTGDLAAFDVDGKQLWARNLQKEFGAFNIMWIYGSSPLLHKGKLYVQVLHTTRGYGNGVPGAAKVDGEAKSYVLAIDPATGKDIWRHDRSDESVGETKESYATPIPHKTAAGREEIIIVGGDAVTGHDPESGREIWRFAGYYEQPGRRDLRIVPSAVVGAGMIFTCVPKGGPVYAIKEGGEGDISANGSAWDSDKSFTSDVCVPLFYKDVLYVLDPNGKKLHQVEPKTGKVQWTSELGGGAVFRASPLGADDKIYCMNANGDVWVVAAADGKVLHKTSLGGEKASRGTPAVTDGMIVIRSGDVLYAFGAK